VAGECWISVLPDEQPGAVSAEAVLPTLELWAAEALLGVVALPGARHSPPVLRAAVALPVSAESPPLPAGAKRQHFPV